jgi:pilus assembly protein Flp/PilA
MSRAWKSVTQFGKDWVTGFGKDQEGAALIEYTVLLGILLIAVIAIIVFVGGWINNAWSNLSAHLP